MSSFTPGERRQPLLRVKGHGVGLSVCYEDAFGEEVIEVLPQAGLLMNVSNDAWFGDSLAPHQHLEMARMRALESGRYLLRATNTGVSVVIDPKGQVRSRSPQFEPHALTAEVWAHQRVTPHARFGNGPVLIAALAMLGLSLAASRRTSTQSEAQASPRRGADPARSRQVSRLAGDRRHSAQEAPGRGISGKSLHQFKL